MLVRIWTVDINSNQIEALEEFANNISLPMFRKQAGCLGVLFTKNSNECATITFWDNQESIDNLAKSEYYQQVVEEINNSGILKGNHKTEIYKDYGGFITFKK